MYIGNKQGRTGTKVICVELNTLSSLLTKAKNVRHHLIRRVEIEENQHKVKSQVSENFKIGNRISSNIRNIVG